MNDSLWDAIKSVVSSIRSHDLLTNRIAIASPAMAIGIDREILLYGRDLIELPDDSRALVSVYDAYDGTKAVDVPLWTKEEGRSDLTLQVTATPVDDGWRLEIDGVHVL